MAARKRLPATGQKQYFLIRTVPAVITSILTLLFRLPKIMTAVSGSISAPVVSGVHWIVSHPIFPIRMLFTESKNQ